MSSTHRRITSEATPKFIARFASTNWSSKVRLAVAGEVPVGNYGQQVQKSANEVGDNFSMYLVWHSLLVVVAS